MHEAGLPLRERTAQWFADNAQRLSLESSLRTVLDGYARGEEPPRDGRRDAQRVSAG